MTFQVVLKSEKMCMNQTRTCLTCEHPKTHVKCFAGASVFQQAFTQFVALALHFDMTMHVFG
jgi:hypothetical protein